MLQWVGDPSAWAWASDAPRKPAHTVPAPEALGAKWSPSSHLPWSCQASQLGRSHPSQFKDICLLGRLGGTGEPGGWRAEGGVVGEAGVVWVFFLFYFLEPTTNLIRLLNTCFLPYYSDLWWPRTRHCRPKLELNCLISSNSK